MTTTRDDAPVDNCREFYYIAYRVKLIRFTVLHLLKGGYGMRKGVLIAIFLAASIAGGSEAARAGNAIYFTSTPGSWIGQGKTVTITSVSASRYYNQGAYTNAVSLSGGGYDLTLVEPNYSLPTVGFYDNVSRWAFMGNGAGMWFTSPGRGDNNISGWFNVLQADYSPVDGSVQAFAVDFKQYDEGVIANWTQGSVRYNSSIPIPAPEPASAAMALMGGVVLLTRRLRSPAQSR